MKLKSKPCRLILLLIILFIGSSSDSAAQTKVKPYVPTKASDTVPGQPYERFFTHDRFGREITFYLSEAPAGQKGPLPLIAYIEGSGCNSRFEERNGKVHPSGGHIVVADMAVGKARVLIIEKPGVKYLSQPRDGCKELAEFNREHTLERWAEAVEAAIRAARKLPQISKDRMLAAGHSEGCLVACRVARDLPQVVTHVATVAGGVPSQLFDLVSLARQGVFFDEVSPDPEIRAQYVLNKWKEIQADPLSADKFFFGFAYRRWSTFPALSPIDELLAVRAKIYITQGTEDKAVDPASAGALFSQLTAKNMQIVYDRVAGANHSFRIKDKPKIDGWGELFKRIVGWFVQE